MRKRETVDPDTLGGQLLQVRTLLQLSQSRMAKLILEAEKQLPEEFTRPRDNKLSTIGLYQSWERNRRRPSKRLMLLYILSECHKFNPELISMARIEKLIRSYEPAIAITPAERAQFFPDETQAKVSTSSISIANVPPSSRPIDAQDRLDVADRTAPFIAGLPITKPGQFFGRAQTLKRLFNLLKAPPLQNAAIIGERHSGKTSLLHYLARITTTPPEQLRPGQVSDWLLAPERYRWVFVDFRNPQLGTREGLMRYLLERLGLDSLEPCAMDSFTRVVSAHLRTPTVILLDDIDVVVKDYPDLDRLFWEGLRSLASNHAGGNLAFVLTAREPFKRLAAQGPIGSPILPLIGYVTTLGPLTEPEARELIASSPVAFGADDVEWILERSELNPMRLQILCRERLLSLQLGEEDDAWKLEAQCQVDQISLPAVGP